MTDRNQANTFRAEPAGNVDRAALVARHSIEVRDLDSRAPLSVGNGEFCFTADVTGLQTFPSTYPVTERYGGEAGTLLGTQSQWGWHSIPSDTPHELESTMRDYESPHGVVPYVDLGGTFGETTHSGQTEAELWLRENPHRLDLGRIGLWTAAGSGLCETFERADVASLSAVEQRLDLATGILSSRFELAGTPYSTTTAAHPQLDAIGVRVEASAGRPIGLRLAFSYGSGAWGNAADWNKPEAHTSTVRTTAHGWVIERTLDETTYFVSIVGVDLALEQVGPHEFVLLAPEVPPARSHSARSPEPRSHNTNSLGANSLSATIGFSRRSPLDLPDAETVFEASATHWAEFWRSGGAVAFSASDHPHAIELERRTVLSQYLTAINCAGSLPPQETGLMLNSWRGKFHLEMHWWHGAHFAQWGRPELLEKSLDWYFRILEKAKATARMQRLPGARWPKQVGPEGDETPSNIGPFLVWQQPHPLYLAELVYRARPDRATLERWAPLVFETAEFMAGFTAAGPRGFELGPPIVPAQESYVEERATARNPTFELAYWSWALGVANEWRARLGLPVNETWAAVADGLVPATIRDGSYAALGTPPFLRREDHPSMLAALGFVPATRLIDPRIMERTLENAFAEWDWESTWGWDYPMAAMTATRIGRPDLATSMLLLDRGKNSYLANGHNWQNDSLPIYLPGNGGLLSAVGLMAAGFDGSAPTPGFGDGWHVAHEGLHRMP